MCLCVCVCVCVCVCARARLCVCVCARACVRVPQVSSRVPCVHVQVWPLLDLIDGIESHESLYHVLATFASLGIRGLVNLKVKAGTSLSEIGLD